MKHNEMTKLFRPTLLLVAAFGLASASNLAFAAGATNDLDATINVVGENGTANDVTHDIEVPNNDKGERGEHQAGHHDDGQAHDANEQANDAKEQANDAKEQAQDAHQQAAEAQGNGDH